MFRIKVVETNDGCHLVNGEMNSRMNHTDFMKLVNFLRKVHTNTLRRDIYEGQPVYEYKTNYGYLMKSVNEYSNDIRLVLG